MAGGNRTPQGTPVATKTSGTTLTISSVTAPQGHCLVVGIACENGAPDTVTHNGRKLRRKVQQNNATDGIHVSVWIKGEYHKEQAGDIVATWGAAIGKRCMSASSYDKAQLRDDDAGASDTAATGNPATSRTGSLVASTALVVETRYEINIVGTTDFTLVGAPNNDVGTLFYATSAGTGTGDCREALDMDDDLVISYFASSGPSTDHASVTARVNTGGSWVSATVGQKVGTTGGDDITLIETYLQVASGSNIRSQLQSATSRKWASASLALQERIPWYRMGITQSDIIAVRALVEAASGDPEEIYFGYNEDEGRWEAYETTTPGTLRAFRRQRTGTWI